MADIHIHRAHTLGLPQARKIAFKWAEEVEKNFDMECTINEGKTTDTVEFSRAGVTGTLLVGADHFDLNAKLGFLMGAFSAKIKAEIEKNLDGLLAAAKPAAKPAAKKVVAAKKASKK